MGDIEKKIDDICEMQSLLISCLRTELGNGVMNVSGSEVGEATDMIKDLTQAEKYLRESCYYKTVIDAMNEPADEMDNVRRGYKPMVDQEPYVNRYLNRAKSDMYRTPYHDYVEAKRHYTATGSSADKSLMDKHAKEHLDQSIDTLSDIWNDASPELKAKMKSEIMKLMESMV